MSNSTLLPQPTPSNTWAVALPLLPWLRALIQQTSRARPKPRRTHATSLPPPAQRALLPALVTTDGETPSIASVSFGDARDFVLRRMQGAPYSREWRPVVPSQMRRYALGGGSLLVMRGTTQRNWSAPRMPPSSTVPAPRLPASPCGRTGSTAC